METGAVGTTRDRLSRQHTTHLLFGEKVGRILPPTQQKGHIGTAGQACLDQALRSSCATGSGKTFALHLPQPAQHRA